MTTLRTPRLLLRPPDRERDLAAVVAACSDPELPRFMQRIPVPYTVEDGRAWLAHVEDEWREGRGRAFVIENRVAPSLPAGSLLGSVAVGLVEGGTVGYWLRSEARGHGVMTEAVVAVVAWAEREHGLRRLQLTTHPGNVASQRVAERAGFVRTGIIDHELPFRDGTTDAVLFEWWSDARAA